MCGLRDRCSLTFGVTGASKSLGCKFLPRIMCFRCVRFAFRVLCHRARSKNLLCSCCVTIAKTQVQLMRFHFCFIVSLSLFAEIHTSFPRTWSGTTVSKIVSILHPVHPRFRLKFSSSVLPGSVSREPCSTIKPGYVHTVTRGDS